MRIKKLQKILKEKKPYYSLQILDAARPRSVSKLMYERMKGTRFEKYVANPVKGSMHNYGIAVDITIVDKDGKEIDMGLSPFNKNDIEIYWPYAKMKMGFKLSEKQKENRKILVVLTDGMVANYGNNHEGAVELKRFVSSIEKEGVVEVIGIGLHSRYVRDSYKNHIVVNKDNLSEELFKKMKQVLS